jgi:hypothetical protein
MYKLFLLALGLMSFHVLAHSNEQFGVKVTRHQLLGCSDGSLPAVPEFFYFSVDSEDEARSYFDSQYCPTLRAGQAFVYGSCLGFSQTKAGGQIGASVNTIRLQVFAAKLIKSSSAEPSNPTSQVLVTDLGLSCIY